MMRNDRLPPLFLKFRKRIAKVYEEIEANESVKKLGLTDEDLHPSIVIHVDYRTLQKEMDKVKSFDHIDLYSLFWVELESKAFYCVFDPNDFSMRIAIVNEDCKVVDYFDHPVDEEGVLSSKNVLPRNRLLGYNIVMSVLGLMTLHKEGKKTSTFTASRNKASVFYNEGDDTVFKRIFDLKRLPSPEYDRPEPGSSGIRKKEHDVIGHWRNYPSGAKVWVKPHKRGDPSLGRITSVFS